MKANQLQEHIFYTYVNLRIGIAVLGLSLPILLVLLGWFLNVDFQNSLSAYFHADSAGHFLRTFFVGNLFAIGVSLYLYKGYSNRENIALNLAGIFAIGVAVFPMTWRDEAGETLYQGIELFSIGQSAVSLHGVCAVLMFLCIAYVCIWCASDTLALLKEEKRRKLYKKLYKSFGVAMIALPVGASLLAMVFRVSDKTIFIVETVGIVTFAAYWWTKSREISASNADKMAIQGQFKI
ncbi:MAG: hypothetical protein AB8G15_01960 [Saprospiraceae bacterium]